MRGVADGTKDQQFTGILGETVFADYMGLPRPDGRKGFDGGHDFVIGEEIFVDVKTMGRTVSVKERYVHNFFGLQKNYNVHYYIFQSYNKREHIITICGYVSHDELLKLASLYPKGSIRTRDDGSTLLTKADLYEIKQSDLHPVFDISQFLGR